MRTRIHGKEGGSTIAPRHRRAVHCAMLLAGLGAAIGCSGTDAGDGASTSISGGTTGTLLAELPISSTHAVRFLELEAGHVVTVEVGVEGEAALRPELLRGTPTEVYRTVARTIGANEAPPAALAAAAAKPAAAALLVAAEAAPPPGAREASVGGPAQSNAARAPAATPNSDGTETVRSALDYVADGAWFRQTFASTSGDEVFYQLNTTWSHSGIIRTGYVESVCLAASQTATAIQTIYRWTGSTWVTDVSQTLQPRHWARYVDPAISTRQALCDGQGPDPHVDMTWIVNWATPTFNGVVDVVSNVKDWWTNDMEGFTHDDQFWYFTASPSHMWGGLHAFASSNPWPTYWSYPLSVPLGRAPAAPDCVAQNLMSGGCDTVMPSPSSLPGRYQLSPWVGIWNHFGDPTVTASPPRLYIPMEPSGGGATVNALGVFDISQKGNPVPMKYLTLPTNSPQTTEGGKGMAWVAYNSMDGFFYSSFFSNATALYVYALNNACSSPPCSLTYLGSIPFIGNNGSPITLSGIQGGKFSTKSSCVWSSCADDRGKLYLSYGYGFYVVDPDYKQWTASANTQMRKAWVRTTVSANSFDSDDEVEGIDVINNQIYQIMINNNDISLQNDAFYLKNYTLTAGSEL